MRKLVAGLAMTLDGVVEAPLAWAESRPLKSGFEAASAIGFRSTSLRIPDAAFQVARLDAYEPWMTGTFVYSETFWALDAVGLRPVDGVAQDG